MNILHLEASSGWGGQEIRILREAEGMRKRGHEIILAVMRGGQLIHRARSAGFTVYEIDFRKSRWVFSFVQLLKLIKKHGIDVVNTHSSLDAWIGGIAARVAGVKVLRTRHLSGAIRPGLNSRLLYGKLADAVVTTCASIIPMIQAQSGARLCKSVPTGVDPGSIAINEEEVKAFREKLGVEKEDVLIGTACFMRSWKGIEDFLKAADKLRSNRKLKWVIIGGGHAETYIAKARTLHVENIVHFAGHLDPPFNAMAALDIFALLSTANEGVSQAILQAAFLGKPLIATGVGGLGEVCIHESNGFQVPPLSPEAVADAVVRLAESRALRLKMGRRSKELVDSTFIFDRTLDEMEEILAALV